MRRKFPEPYVITDSEYELLHRDYLVCAILNAHVDRLRERHPSISPFGFTIAGDVWFYGKYYLRIEPREGGKFAFFDDVPRYGDVANPELWGERFELYVGEPMFRCLALKFAELRRLQANYAELTGKRHCKDEPKKEPLAETLHEYIHDLCIQICVLSGINPSHVFSTSHYPVAVPYSVGIEQRFDQRVDAMAALLKQVDVMRYGQM